MTIPSHRMSKTTSKTSPSLEKREQYQKKSQDTKPQYPTSPGQAQNRRQCSHQRQSRITRKSNNQQILLRRSKQSSQPRILLPRHVTHILVIRRNNKPPIQQCHRDRSIRPHPDSLIPFTNPVQTRHITTNKMNTNSTLSRNKLCLPQLMNTSNPQESQLAIQSLPPSFRQRRPILSDPDQFLLRQSFKQSACNTIIDPQSLRQQSPTHRTLTPNQNQRRQNLQTSQLRQWTPSTPTPPRKNIIQQSNKSHSGPDRPVRSHTKPILHTTVPITNQSLRQPPQMPQPNNYHNNTHRSIKQILHPHRHILLPHIDKQSTKLRISPPEHSKMTNHILRHLPQTLPSPTKGQNHQASNRLHNQFQLLPQRYTPQQSNRPIYWKINQRPSRTNMFSLLRRPKHLHPRSRPR